MSSQIQKQNYDLKGANIFPPNTKLYDSPFPLSSAQTAQSSSRLTQSVATRLYKANSFIQNEGKPLSNVHSVRSYPNATIRGSNPDSIEGYIRVKGLKSQLKLRSLNDKYDKLLRQFPEFKTEESRVNALREIDNISYSTHKPIGRAYDEFLKRKGLDSKSSSKSTGSLWKVSSTRRYAIAPRITPASKNKKESFTKGTSIAIIIIIIVIILLIVLFIIYKKCYANKWKSKKQNTP